MKIFITFWVVYFCGGMLTGAYWYQHRADQFNRGRELGAMTVGVGWPVYWSARAALKITE